jgi:Uma2 family endonuclease
MTATAEKLYTPEDLLALGNGFELIDGRLVEKNTGMEASVVAVNLSSLLRTHEQAHSRGYVCDGDTGYQIFAERPNLVRKPDGSFIARERLPDGKPVRGHVRIPPDLGFEVVSPNDLAEEVNTKVMAFLRAGVQLVWVLYPQTRTILVLRPGGSAAYLTDADELSGEEVIPGFACRVAEVFADV